MEFKFPHAAFEPRHWPRFLNAVKDSVEKTDFDSGFVSNPGDLVFVHALGVIPRIVHVQTSANQDGENFIPDTFTAINSQTITVTGTRAYTRVQLNK